MSHKALALIDESSERAQEKNKKHFQLTKASKTARSTFRNSLRLTQRVSHQRTFNRPRKKFSFTASKQFLQCYIFFFNHFEFEKKLSIKVILLQKYESKQVPKFQWKNFFSPFIIRWSEKFFCNFLDSPNYIFYDFSSVKIFTIYWEKYFYCLLTNKLA